MNVDRLLGLGEHPANRQFGALSLGNRLLQESSLFIAGDRDHHRSGR